MTYSNWVPFDTLCYSIGAMLNPSGAKDVPIPKGAALSQSRSDFKPSCAVVTLQGQLKFDAGQLWVRLVLTPEVITLDAAEDSLLTQLLRRIKRWLGAKPQAAPPAEPNAAAYDASHKEAHEAALETDHDVAHELCLWYLLRPERNRCCRCYYDRIRLKPDQDFSQLPQVEVIPSPHRA